MREPAGIDDLRLRLDGALAGRLTPEQRLEAMGAFITEERGRIERAHRAGAEGREIVACLSDLADVVIEALFRGAEVACGGPSKVGDAGCALVALGGYGRRELNPASDVDLMLLFSEREDAYLRTLTDCLFHMLVNLRFELGYAFRSIADCLELADTDQRSLTSMLEARFLIGEPAIFDQFQTRFRRFLTPTRVDSFVEWKLAEQERRHKAYPSSLHEPNVKESPGGPCGVAPNTEDHHEF
jgi:[protein-PII] uridylyltransferase